MNEKQEQLFHWIAMVSFMMVDLAEFLDTHPYEEQALVQYNHYRKLYEEALEEYSKHYHPLRQELSASERKWSWNLSKNPWERGYV